MLLPLTRTTMIRSPRPADGPRPLSAAGGWPPDGPRSLTTAGGRPQVAHHGRRTAPGRSPRPSDGPRSLSTVGGRPQAALHGRRTAPGRCPRPATDDSRPHSTAGGRLRGRSSHSILFYAFVIAELLENLSVGDNRRHISQELVTTTV